MFAKGRVSGWLQCEGRTVESSCYWAQGQGKENGFTKCTYSGLGRSKSPEALFVFYRGRNSMQVNFNTTNELWWLRTKPSQGYYFLKISRKMEIETTNSSLIYNSLGWEGVRLRLFVGGTLSGCLSVNIWNSVFEQSAKISHCLLWQEEAVEWCCWLPASI